MKKTLIFILIITAVVVIVCATSILENNQKVQAVKKFNQEYEMYLDKEIFGADVATLINKAVNTNLKNNIMQDEEKNFIANDTNSLQIEICFLYDEETGETRTYNMEKVYYRGIQEFIQNFNLTTFKIDSIEYHQTTGRVSKIVFKQIEA